MSACATWLKDYLRGWANQIAARYAHPVYLVGSALTEEAPRDHDVVVVLPDELFRNRFGGSYSDCVRLGPVPPGGPQDIWAREVAKITLQAMRYHPGARIDFKVQDESGAPEGGRLRIDAVDLEAP